MAVTTRRRLTPEARREEIVAVTESLISARGFWGLTMSEVAKAAGMTQPGVLHYFTTKDELMLAVLDRRDTEDLAAIMAEAGPITGPEKFAYAVQRLVERNVHEPELLRMYSILNAEALSEDHPAYAYFVDRHERGVDALAALATGWHPDPHRVGLHVQAMLDGLPLAWMRNPAIDAVETWRSWACAYFDIDADQIPSALASTGMPDHSSQQAGEPGD